MTRRVLLVGIGAGDPDHLTRGAVRALNRTDVVFLGANGVDVEHGLTTPDHSEAAAKRAMVRTGRRVVVLADSSKVGQDHTVRFAEAGEIDTLVTDDGVSDVDVKALQDRGVEVVVA